MERVPYKATTGALAYAALHLPVAILLDNVRSMYNVGAFFRTADGAGIERLLLSGITARPPQSAIHKTALGAEDRVPWESITDAAVAVDQLRAREYEIAAIETSALAVDLFAWQPRFPVCVLFGHEVDGPARGFTRRLRYSRPHSDARIQALAECGKCRRHRNVRTAAQIPLPSRVAILVDRTPGAPILF